jgi:putative restriction endonuclease
MRYARPMDLDAERAIRASAFSFLDAQRARHGDALPWSILQQGFTFDGRRVPLIAQQGIFKPAILDLPLSIRTTPPEEGKPPPYEDGMGPDGLLRYRCRGTDPGHYQNVWLRRAMQHQVPLVYLFGVVEGQYLPAYPVYIVGDDPRELTFRVAVDDRALAARDAATAPASLAELPALNEHEQELRRNYATRVTLQRLHQETFRQRVLRAYRDRCAICRLKHTELLDAAHILPDGDPRGEPIVPNGLALCRLHHAAFDRYVIGIRRDLVIEVRRDVLEERDGPMLRYGLQEIEGQRLLVPSSAAQRPREEFLDERYALFKKAG